MDNLSVQANNPNNEVPVNRYEQTFIKLQVQLTNYLPPQQRPSFRWPPPVHWLRPPTFATLHCVPQVDRISLAMG